MAERLNAEQIAERRSNLRAFRTLLNMTGDSELTTTLLMQEEWLATVDASEAHIAGVTKQLQRYDYDAHTIRGLRTRKCLISGFVNEMGKRDDDCTDFWRDNRLYCAPCYLRSIHGEKATAEEGETSPPARVCLREAGGLALVCEDCYDDIAEYCGPCWLREVRKPEEPEEPLPTIQPLSKFKDVSEYKGGIPKIQEWVEDTECDTNGHVWIKMGKVGFGDSGLSVVNWGDAQCLRCHIPAPVPDFDVQEEEEPNVCTNCQHDEHYWANDRIFNNPCGTMDCLCTRYLPFRVVGGH